MINSESVGIREFFKTILENYLDAKSDEKLAKKLITTYANKSDFQKYLVKIANLYGRGDYDTYGYFGGADKLIILPRVVVYDKNEPSPFFIRFSFREDMKGAYISLNDSYRNAEKTLKKQSIKFDKFDAKHVEHIEERASEARDKLNKSTTIPDDFIQKINLNSENATTASSIEASSVYSKYYELETLPPEEDLVSDFKEFLRLYEDLVDIPDRFNIREPLSFIFENLPLAKRRNEKPKDHEVGRAFLDIKDAIFEIANLINPEKDYNSIAYYQDKGNWYWKPYIYVEDKANKDKFGHWDQHFVGFWFTEDLNHVLLSLEQSNNYTHNLLAHKLGKYTEEELQNYLIAHASQIKKQLNESVKISDDLLEESSKATETGGINDYPIYGKLYDKNDLPPNEQIISDFKELFNLYSYLKPDENVSGEENGKSPVEIKGELTVEANRTFFEFLTDKGYLFDPKLVENFLLSLKVKPFVILTGNSGTGKTKVAQLFAQYLSKSDKSKDSSFVTKVKVGQSAKGGGWALNKASFFKFYPELKEHELTFEIKVDNIKGKGTLTPWPYMFFDKAEGNVKKRLEDLNSEKKVKLEILIPKNNGSKYEIIPVGANWTENRHVVGFYNAITEEYQKTSSLDLILDARKDISEPYFLILDEMNLSHVERYFSDFLSTMESQEAMPLHDNADEEVPKDLRLPKNLLVVGTVNVDETTYMFSPKVLDRANTIEFLTHNPIDYMKNDFDNDEPSGDIDYIQNPLSDIEPNIRKFTIDHLRELMKDIKTSENEFLWDIVSLEIDNIYKELKKAGFDFGFRVVNEIMRFMYVAWKYEREPDTWENWERYFDAQIKQKMLPKLHGSQRTLQEVIKFLFEICYGGEIDKDPRLISDYEIGVAKYPSAAFKLREMDKVLYDQRYVAFIN